MLRLNAAKRKVLILKPHSVSKLTRNIIGNIHYILSVAGIAKRWKLNTMAIFPHSAIDNALSGICFAIALSLVSGNFVYPDFNQTLGLVLNGATITTDCGLEAIYLERHGLTSSLYLQNETRGENIQIREKGGIIASQTVVTDKHDNYSVSIESQEAQFGHRDNFVSSIDSGCRSRLRLTDSVPSQAGSVWYEKRLPVVRLCH